LVLGTVDARGDVVKVAPNHGAIGSLTLRERQIVTLAAAGQHNKLIAYNLGISHSTVRVLMGRAARRLRASSRAALIHRYVQSNPSAIEVPPCHRAPRTPLVSLPRS